MINLGDVMPEIKAILLVPAEGDPHGLLKEGPCGARPPMAYWYKGAWAPCTARAAHSHDKRRALVLAWDGKTVREGCDRADWSGVWVDDLRRLCPDLRRLCTEIGTLALLDADGKEIK